MYLNPVYSVNPPNMYLASREDPYEMLHNAAFHMGLRFLLRSKHFSGIEIHYNLEIPTCDPPKYMGRNARKPVFGVNSDKMRFKPACSATKASWKTEILLVAIREMILSDERITKTLISLRGLRLCWLQPPKGRFSHVEAHIILIAFICMGESIRKQKVKML